MNRDTEYDADLERRISEDQAAERDARGRKARARAERRERIATAVLASQAGNAPVVALGGPHVDRMLVSTSIGLANLLIEHLDQELAAELEEARS